MQVERKPTMWPWMVMLGGLLLFCLNLPRYWHQSGTAAESSTPTEPDHFAGPANSTDSHCELPPVAGGEFERRSQLGGTHFGAAPQPAQFVLDNDLLSLWPAPTIDDLISARLGLGNSEGLPVEWPTFVPRAASEGQSGAAEPSIEFEASKVDPAIASALEQLGRAFAVYAPQEVLPRWTTRAAVIYQRWSTHPGNPNGGTASATLRMLPPKNQLTNDEQQNEYLPNTTPEEGDFDLQPAVDPWCVPEALLEQLERIARHPHATYWARHTIAQLHRLREEDSRDGESVRELLAELCESAQAATRLADETADDRLRVELLRAHWALARRLDRWSVVHDIQVAARAGQRFAARGSLGTYFDDGPDSLEGSTAQLTRSLEDYEQTRNPQLARQIVAEKRVLENSADSLDRALADAVEQHYRNANIRVAISAEMLNRFVGQERSEMRPLRDRIGGANIRGQSRLQSTSRVKLDPATGRWDVDVESTGTIHSNALADGGQARFRSQTATDFSARKRVVVDSQGVLMQPASINVDSHNRLMGVTTDMDWIPFVGSFARDRALQEYRARQSRAKAHVEAKVASEATHAIDEETREAVERVERQLRERIVDRLAPYGVKLTPVELTTQHERVVARLRLASDEQAGSHTPRPRALSDSLASAQVHESALTNAAVGLDLDGRRFTGAELADHFRKKFPKADGESKEHEQRDTAFHFADEDAVRVQIEDGKVEITLSMASVEVDGRRINDFRVHTFYVPVVNGLQAELVRDGSLGIEGRLSSGARARLHNVFNSVLPAERTLPIVRLEDPSDSRLAGLMITQMVLEDGWIGVAVGPASNERVAERSRSLR